MAEALVRIENVAQHFKVGKDQILKAVDGVSFSIRKGETFGLVGESGCGKSTLGRTIIGLYQATKGNVYFDGIDIGGRKTLKQKNELSRRMQMIFQDPYTSLNPRMKIMDIVAEGIDNHHLARSSAERTRMVVELLNSVGLDEQHANRYPHEFSGGQRQRVGIARALSVNPDFVIADEPISALDVSIQAQVVNLMQSLQKSRKLTYLFIAHDLSMVKYISDRIGVMYLGNLMELTDSEELFNNPMHPYTQALLSAIPVPDPKVEHQRERIVLEGSVTSPINLPDNCRFCTRCRFATEKCSKAVPPLKEVKPGHFVACHLV
ncbi:MAG: ABC transporter ATP-binding protein [Candidatus Faecivicinus sp.]